MSLCVVKWNRMENPVGKAIPCQLVIKGAHRTNCSVRVASKFDDKFESPGAGFKIKSVSILPGCLG